MLLKPQLAPATQKLNPPVFVWILIMVAILAGAFEIYKSYISSKTPENTQNQITQIDSSAWKTYRNEELGFEIKYPSDWYYSEPIYKNGPVAFSSAPESSNIHGLGIPPKGNMWVTIFKTKCSENLDAQYSELDSDIEISYTLEKEICNKGYNIFLNLWKDDPDLDNHKKILDQILSTFKFIK